MHPGGFFSCIVEECSRVAVLTRPRAFKGCSRVVAAPDGPNRGGLRGRDIRPGKALFIILQAAGLLLLAGCRPEPVTEMQEPATGLFPIVLQTDWFPQAEHGGFYQAAARGFFRNEGLDVEILPGGPGAMIKHKVTRGQAHFAMNRSDDVVVAIDRGLPLIMVFAVMQRDPQALMMHPSQAVAGFRELDGRTVIASPGLNWIPVIERQYSIRLNIQPHTYGLTHFLKDESLVQQCFVTSEPYYVRQHGVDPVVLMLADSGYEPYHVVFANREFADEAPDRVAAFARASLRGWADYLEGDPTAAHKVIMARNPNMTPEFLEFSRRTMIEQNLVTGDPSKGDELGRIDPGRLQTEIDRLREFGMIDEPLLVEEVVVPSLYRE
ncbi:MAG: myristoyl transferase [Verrucomicrobia bacterium]|nr:MAG: myristoyl transferase [Verrucomicrobiota bacterium]